MNDSLTPWLSEFHVGWFSGNSVVFCFYIGCYPTFGCVKKQSISIYTSILAGNQCDSICIYMSVCIYIHIHECVYIYTYTWVCVYIYIHECVCIYIYSYIYTHTHTHIYISIYLTPKYVVYEIHTDQKLKVFKLKIHSSCDRKTYILLYYVWQSIV